jgi:hypothetical protein
LAGAAAFAYVVVFAAVFSGQRWLMYAPNTNRTNPQEIGLIGYTENELVTPDGARLVVWYAPPRAGRKTLLYMHGNAGDLADRRWRFHTFRKEGWGVLAVSWRGYSGSTGRPSEAAIVADAQLAYDALIARWTRAEDIVLYGESLGSGAAVQIAARNQVGGVVLDAPYTSTVDVAALRFPYLPVRWAMFDRFESTAHIGRVRAPLLVVHGVLDRVIPIEQGRALYEMANEPKQFVSFAQGGHVNLFQHGALEVLRAFMARLEQGTPEPAG